ncbi:MAG: hypothetical protein ACTHJ3_01935 [Pararhizobium sp.]
MFSLFKRKRRAASEHVPSRIRNESRAGDFGLLGVYVRSLPPIGR